MVADAQQQPQPTSVEDEAVKRNTDCVYFLASPLTCKKGSECEYRHSEYARVNPRDCWYWLNSACLNPKCAFRHPPIEGLLGVQTPQSSAGFPVPSAQTTVAPTVTPVVPVTQSSIKQPVTCVFFQKGYCMKGDKCSFLHGPNPSTTAKPAQASSNPPQGIESSNIKVFSGGLKNCSQEQKLPHVNTAKSVVGAQPHRAELISKQLTLPGHGFGIERSLLPIKPYDDERIRGKAMVPPPMSNGVPNNHRPNRVSSDHGFHNGKEADEFMRESSPGFDVLVENELRDEEYFHGEDRQYDMDRPISAADVDPDRFHDNPRSFEPRSRGQYDSWEPRRDRDRKPVGPPQLDRRGYRKSISPDNIEGLDLRHQLSKHKRVNGSRSSLDRYDAHERHGDDRSHRSSRRDSQQHKGPLSSRLRGRINFGPESRVDRELDRPRSSRGRVSPKRPETMYEGRFRDRLKGRVSDGRSGRDGREMVSYEGIVDLSAAVKGSSEVRRGGAEIIKEPSILGKRKSVASQPQPTSEDVSFDGPMPLSEILKRKREASQQRETPQAGLEREEGELGNKLERDDVAVETMEDEKVIGDLEVGDGVAYDEAALEDQELDQAHGEYEYEELEVEEEEDEGEYEVEGEEEYLEDEEDDFAKKIGVLSS